MKCSIHRIALLFILALAAVLRLWKLGWDLPYVSHPDEPVSVNVALQIFQTGDLNPHFFDYPSLYFYLNALSYVPYFLVKFATGAFDSRMNIAPLVIQGMGVTFAPMTAPVLLSRLTTAMFSLGSVALVYFIGRRLTDKPWVGLLAALMMAVSLSNAEYGRLVTPDTYAVFFILFSFAGTVLIYRAGKLRHYILAGCMAGFAVSCKYNAGLIVLPMVAAHLLRWGRRSYREPGLYIAAFSAVLGFLLTTPYAILDYPSFMRGLASTAVHYSTGHVGMEGDALRWYIGYLWKIHGLIVILSGLEILRGLWRRVPETILLALYPVVYFALISQFSVRNDRTILLLTPFMFLLTASLLVTAWTAIERLSRGQTQRVIRLALVVATVLLIAWPFTVTVRRVGELPNTRAAQAAAREWIIRYVPAGAHIAIEAYAPYLPPERYIVSYATGMTDHPAEWYLANGVEYLVFSAGMFGRFYREPERYQEQIDLYEQLFRQFPPIATFNQGGPEIRISELDVVH